jgi:hypothetical protein
MLIQFDSDGSEQGDGFAADVTCVPAGGGDPGGGRRRQQVAAATNDTSSRRDILAETNVDSYRFDDDRCISFAEADAVEACQAIQEAWEADAAPGDRDPTELKDNCEATEGCQFLAGQKAFVFLIPLDFSEQTVELNITSLMDYLWVDQKTSVRTQAICRCL